MIDRMGEAPAVRPVPHPSGRRALAAVLQRAVPERGPGAVGGRALPGRRRTRPVDPTPSRRRPRLISDSRLIWPTRSRLLTTAPASSTRFRSPTAPSAPPIFARSKSGRTIRGSSTYDPAFMNTAACRSRITYIDGDKGILEYRGYPIEQLAEHSTYLETAYLIIFGELPTDAQLKEWTQADHAPHDAAREHQEADGRVPVRRPSDGRVPQHGRRVLDLLPRREEDLRRAVAQEADPPADRQGPDASPPTPTATASAAPTSTPTTT